jgi:peptide/nickel transport system ATP-binding protein
MSDEPLVAVRDLYKTFDHQRGFGRRRAEPVTAVDGISFEIEKGQTVGLVGESGSGKSTAANLILQLVRPTQGVVRFRGVDLTELGGEALRLARRQMQIVFQDPYAALDPRLKVREIVREPLAAYGVGTPHEQRQRVDALLELVGLDRTLGERRPREFSGGQRQRIAIARALALNPEFVICDEPTSALDLLIQAQILNLLRQLQDRLSLTYLFITHDLGVVRVMSDRIIVMHNGKIVETGPAADVYERPQDPYTQRLLRAVPVIDTQQMAARAEQRRQPRGGGDGTGDG